MGYNQAALSVHIPGEGDSESNLEMAENRYSPTTVSNNTDTLPCGQGELMKKKYFAAAFAVFVSVAYADPGENGQGANPPGGGYGCLDNPSAAGCILNNGGGGGNGGDGGAGGEANSQATAIGTGIGYGGTGIGQSTASAKVGVNTSLGVGVSAEGGMAHAQGGSSSSSATGGSQEQSSTSSAATGAIANSASADGAGAGAGANSGNVQIHYESFSRQLSLSSIMAPEAKGDVKMDQWSACQARFKLPRDKDGNELPFETFENNARTALLLGIITAKDKVQTAVGPIPPMDTKEPYREVVYTLGPIMTKRLGATHGYFLTGHQYKMVAGVVASSGGSKMTLQKGSNGDLGDFGNTGGSGMPQVGIVIMECQLDAGIIKTDVVKP